MTNSPGAVFQPSKILLIKPSALGDVIHALPVLQMLHDKFPGAKVHWVVAKGFHGILERHPLIEKLWIIDKNSWKKPSMALRTFSELRSLAAALRRERYDLVIDLQGLFRSAMIGMFSGAAERVGFDAAREGARYTYKYRVKVERELHAVEKNILVGRFLGCESGRTSFPLPPLDLSPEVSQMLPSEYAVIAPSAGTLVKRWPAPFFAEVAARLPFPSIIVGTPSDVELAGEVAARSNGRAVSLAGKTSLKELAAVIAGSRFLLTSDSGPMHIAAALEVPVFAVFGPTNPARTGPFGSVHTVIRKEMPCSPCYKRKPCPDWRCMTEITPETVLRIIEGNPAPTR